MSKTSGSDSLDFHSINHSISEYDPLIREFFESISLVPKLRETRAFVGFSRLEPDQKPIAERKKELRLGNKEDWLPAVEVFGEGIFFKFNSKKLEIWAKRADVQKRIDRLNHTFHKAKFGNNALGDLRPG